MRLHEVTSLLDPLYEAFLDGFQDGFPDQEQIRLSVVHRIVKAKTLSATAPADAPLDPFAASMHLLVAVADDEQPCGLAMWQDCHNGVAYLLYLWVDPARRGAGLGSRIYRGVLDQARATMGEARALTCEVERPDVAQSLTQAQDAVRRIAFYQRLGARLASNVVYVQHCGRDTVPPLLMHLMIHPLAPLSEAEMLDIMSDCYGEAMQRPERLELV